MNTNLFKTLLVRAEDRSGQSGGECGEHEEPRARRQVSGGGGQGTAGGGQGADGLATRFLRESVATRFQKMVLGTPMLTKGSPNRHFAGSLDRHDGG